MPRTLLTSGGINTGRKASNRTKPRLTQIGLRESYYYDGFRRKFLPNASQLVRDYKRVVYTCANLNAYGVINTPLRLFLKRTSSTSKCLLRKGIETKAIPSEHKDFLSSVPYLQKTLRSFVDIEEVIVHPALDLLDKANSSRHMDGIRLMEHTQLYQEVTGRTYWLITVDAFQRPQGIWILPTQFVEPVKTSQNSNIIDFYEFRIPGSGESKKYKPEDIIPFLMPSVQNPYIDGIAPLEASFQSNELSNQFVSHEQALLENKAMPEAMLTPKDSENVLSEETAQQWERRFKWKFGRGRGGGVWVPEEALEYTPIQVPPRDLAQLKINNFSEKDIANCFQIPYALIAEASHNRQQLEAAERQHGKYGLRPRTFKNACVLNKYFLPMYDDSELLFFAYDDPVPEDETVKVQKSVQFVMNGIWTPNEARNVDGTYGEHPNGDELRAINVSPELMRQNARDSGESEK